MSQWEHLKYDIIKVITRQTSNFHLEMSNLNGARKVLAPFLFRTI